jgi:hypothetical protein
MLPRMLSYALPLVTAAAWLSPQAPAQSAPATSPWLRTESRRFEIHYAPTVAPAVDRVSLSAERAYDRVSTRLRFVLATKVPLVMFAPAGPMTRDEAVAHAVSERVAPHHPHRSRIVVPIPEDDAQLDALMVHELTHLLVCEIILPSQSGTGGVPSWVHEGIANYMVGTWSDGDERLMRELVASDRVPPLSQLADGGGFADPRTNEVLGRVAFDYIESRWGPTSVRRFVDALIVPRASKTYDAVFELTPAEFDAAFRQYSARRFAPTLVRTSAPQPATGQTKTASGLVYEVVVRGTGDVAMAGDTVRIHESLSLPDGKVIFDSRAKNQPVMFVLGAKQVIPGVDEGVTGMRVGERRTLWVPPSLDGRTFDPTFIPPGATRHYDIELVEIVKK